MLPTIGLVTNYLMGDGVASGTSSSGRSSAVGGATDHAVSWLAIDLIVVVVVPSNSFLGVTTAADGSKWEPCSSSNVGIGFCVSLVDVDAVIVAIVIGKTFTFFAGGSTSSLPVIAAMASSEVVLLLLLVLVDDGNGGDDADASPLFTVVALAEIPIPCDWLSTFSLIFAFLIVSADSGWDE